MRPVARESDACDALRVRLREAAHALAGAHAPHFDAAILATACEQLRVAREVEAEDRHVVHHQLVPRLVLEVLAQLAALKVPHLDEAVDRAGDEVLTVGREARALRVRLLAKLDHRPRRGEGGLGLDDALRRGATEEVKLAPARQHALVLLPLERLAEQRQQPRGRHDRHLRLERLRQVGAPPLLARARAVRLERLEVWSSRQRLELAVALGLLRLHRNHRRRRAQDLPRCVEFAQLEELEHELLVQVGQQRRWQLERRDCRHHGLPVPLLDVVHEGVEAVDCVERDLRLVLQGQERLGQAILLEELQHDAHHVVRLDLALGCL